MNLKNLGFEIYTNIAPNEFPIDGTIPLQLDLRQIFFTAEKAQFCIGIHSGVIDLISQSNARIIAIDISTMFDLKDNFHRAGLKSIYWRIPEYPERWYMLNGKKVPIIDSPKNLECVIIDLVQNFKE